MYNWIIDMGDPQKKRSNAYRMERRHVAVQSGKEDQNHLQNYSMKLERKHSQCFLFKIYYRMSLENRFCFCPFVAVTIIISYKYIEHVK